MNPRRCIPRNRPGQRHFPPIITALMRDRDGHWTAQTHDSLRHLTDVYDFIGRHTQMSWCTCGALESITDPKGNVTAWTRDLQNRVTSKIYPDLTQIAYNYETNSSRLLSVTDAKNQTTRYGYYVDNNLKSVSYSNAVVATPVELYTPTIARMMPKKLDAGMASRLRTK